MKNRNMWKLNDIIEIKICGKNIHNYIKRVLIKNKIDILKLTYLNYKEVLVVLRYKDYLKVRSGALKLLWSMVAINIFNIKTGDIFTS